MGGLGENGKELYSQQVGCIIKLALIAGPHMHLVCFVVLILAFQSTSSDFSCNM